MNLSSLLKYGSAMIMTLCLYSCQLVNYVVESEKKEGYKDILQKEDNLCFYINHLHNIRGFTKFKMEVSKGQLKNLIKKINDFERISYETRTGEYYPDGIRCTLSYGYHAFSLAVYEGDEKYDSIVSIPVSPDRYLDYNSLKMDISPYFTEKSWRKVDFDKLEPKMHTISMPPRPYGADFEFLPE